MTAPAPTHSAHQKPPGGLANRLGVGAMRVLARLPLSWIRALGWVLGQVLHAVAVRRRRIARTNWALVFPDHGTAARHAAVRRHFVLFAQAWLDRSWLWEAPPHVVRRRLLLKGDLAALEGHQPTVLFAPHFVGMDAGWTALTVHLNRRFCGIYAEQLNADVDRWMSQGRQRFGDPHIVAMRQGLKPLVAALREGLPLYLLPDMDYGTRDSVFVPFFDIPTATITSLSRFARMAHAQVVPVVSRMTREGYEVTVRSPWQGYPVGDVQADTAEMNRRLEGFIRAMPEQYYWVHKRFKSRPPGEPSFYDGD